MVFQVGTYISTAAVWYLTLQQAKVPYSLRTLVPLGVAKLFSEQALPSGGISGTAFFVTALNRRGVSTELCMAALLVSLVSYYTAYIFAAILSLSLLWSYHATTPWVVVVTILFCVIAVVIPSGTLWLHRRSQRSLPAFLVRIPGLNKVLDLLGDAPGDLLRNVRLLSETTLFQCCGQCCARSG